MLHPSFFTPEQLARADELAGDLTLATGDAARDQLFRHLQNAVRVWRWAFGVCAPEEAYLRLCTETLVDAKNRWIDACGALPEL
jgi:hypothetical protein